MLAKNDNFETSFLFVLLILPNVFHTEETSLKRAVTWELFVAHIMRRNRNFLTYCICTIFTQNVRRWQRPYAKHLTNVVDLVVEEFNVKLACLITSRP